MNPTITNSRFQINERLGLLRDRRDWLAKSHKRDIYSHEVERSCEALVEFKNEAYRHHAQLWPEMVCSLMMHGPIEKGRDMTDFGAVDYNYVSVNALGVPNVSDSLYALKTAVFEQGKFSLKEVRNACRDDWNGDGEEAMRRYLLNLPKFGNDEDGPDAMEALRHDWTLAELLDEVRRDEAFYADGGGGVTVSGGEPLAQWRFVRDILRGCHEAGIHTALEHCTIPPERIVLKGRLAGKVDA